MPPERINLRWGSRTRFSRDKFTGASRRTIRNVRSGSRSLFDFDGAVFEFGDLAVGVQRVGGEDVGGGFSEMERDEDAARFDGIVGADCQADGSSAAADADVVAGCQVQGRDVGRVHGSEGVGFD